MICSSVNLPRFIVQSLQQGRTLILRGGKTQWQVSAYQALSILFFVSRITSITRETLSNC
jgi:hypothetical protein